MWEARSIIVLVLAVAVAVVCILSIGSLAIYGRPLTDVGADVLIAILGAVVAIVAGFVAQTHVSPRGRDDEPPPPHPDDESRGPEA